MRALALVALLAASGCSAVLKFDQCTADDGGMSTSCTLADGTPGYCTSDHICTTDIPSDRICQVDPSSSSDPGAVTIAGLFRLTGGTAAKDTVIRDGVSGAIGQINGVGLRTIRLLTCDTQGDPTTARKAMSIAVETYGAVAIIGPTSSAELLAIAMPGSSLPEKYGVPVISGAATAGSISGLGNLISPPPGSDDPKISLVWRTSPSDTVQASVLASTAVFSTYSASTVVHTAFVNSTYGSSLSSDYDTDLTTQYGITATSMGFDSGTDPTDVATFLADPKGTQVALIVADDDAPSWITALPMGNGLTGTQFLFTDGAKGNNLFSQLTGSASTLQAFFQRVKGTGPGVTKGNSAAYAGLTAAVPAADGDPADTAFVANTYDATYAVVLAMGIVQAGQVTGAVVADGLSRLSGGTSYSTNPSDFAMAYPAMSAHGGIQLVGSSGTFDFDPNTGDQKGAQIEIWGVDDSTGTPKFTTISVQ